MAGRPQFLALSWLRASAVLLPHPRQIAHLCGGEEPSAHPIRWHVLCCSVLNFSLLEVPMAIQTARLRELALSDSGFVFDPMTGHTFTVNPSGLRILRWLKDGVELEEVAHRLANDFEVQPGEDPARDVQDFLAQLRECGLMK